MPHKHLELAGQTFTHKDRSFQVIDIHHRNTSNEGGGVHWNCLCKCGTLFVASASQITRKTVTRCKNCRVPPVGPTEKACVKCGVVFPCTTEFFVSSPQFRFGIRPVCKTCYNPKARKYSSDRTKAMRLEILSHYSPGGIPHCVCCKESHFEFLAIDHIEGGSQEDYRKHTNGATYYRDIIKSGFPDRFRVLCHNCNICAKNYGYCIHNPETIKFHKSLLRNESVLTPADKDFKGPTQSCTKCSQTFPISAAFFSVHRQMATGFLRMCKDCQRSIACKLNRELKEKRRLEIFSHYSQGAPKCACCGADEQKFLSIDHINGGGSKHRKENNIHNFYYWIIKNNFPDDLRVLCYNCNLASGFYGECPHVRENT